MQLAPVEGVAFIRPPAPVSNVSLQRFESQTVERVLLYIKE